MLKKLFDFLTPRTSSPAVKSGGVDLFKKLSGVMNRSGRVSVDYVSDMANAMETAAFVGFVDGYVLAGSAVLDGDLLASHASSQKQGSVVATLMFKPSAIIEKAREAAEQEPIQRAIYPLVKGNESATPDPHHFVVGRERGTDIVVPDFSISRAHAAIRIKGGRYYISDTDSSNGTFVNGKQIGRTAVEIKDGDKIAFARIEFAILSPEGLYRLFARRE